MYQQRLVEKSSTEALLPMLETQQPPGQQRQKPTRRLLLLAVALSCSLLFFSNALFTCLRQTGHVSSRLAQTKHGLKGSSRLEDFRTCSIKNFEATGLPFLDGVQPICHDEFVSRRQRLAQALLSDGADAFVVEPGKHGNHSFEAILMFGQRR
jgi:hypothetical protein